MKIQCSVCGKKFKTRQDKYYHKTRFAKGTGCNVAEKAGRPGFKTEEERQIRKKQVNEAYNLKMKEQRALKRKEKLQKLSKKVSISIQLVD